MQPQTAWWLSGATVSAGLASVLLIGGWVVADELQPVSYSPVRQTLGVLAGHAGTDRWIMTMALFSRQRLAPPYS